MTDMTSKEQAELALKVLLQECEHVQDAIARLVSTLNGSFGIVLPAVFGVVLFSASQGDLHLPMDVVGFALIGMVSVTFLYSSSLSVEALKYMRYKYSQLHPRLYRIAERSAEHNFVQFLATTTEKYAWGPTLIFQVVVFAFAGALSFFLIYLAPQSSTHLALQSSTRNALQIGSGLLALSALASAIWVWLFGMRVMKQIADSVDSVEAVEAVEAVEE